MQRNVWLSLLALLLSCNLFSAPVNKWYTGKKHNQFVYIQMNDSVAYAEYIYVDHHHIVHGKFDTLILKQSKFVGMFSEIDIHVQNYTFIPGHLALQPGKPEEAWNPMRNEGYMQYLNEKLTVKLGWTRFEFKEFRDVDHVNKNSDPFEYRKVMDAKFDSLYQFYTSGTTTRQFMRVTICDEKLWHKKYRIITDSEEILNLWKFLASSYPVKVKSWPYLVQYPLSVLPLLKFNFDVAILSTPFVYPALIATEIFVIDRFNAGKTYRIIFQPRDIGTNGCRLKVRNSMIMGFKYHFVLSSNFEKQVFK